MTSPNRGSRFNQDPIDGCLVLNDGTATARVGRAVMLSASAASTVTLTLFSGATIDVNPQVGDNIYPFAVTEYVVNSGTISAAYNLF